MRYGIVFSPAVARIALASLAALLLGITGCDSSLPPPQSLHAATAAPYGDTPGGRRLQDPARNRVWILNEHGLFLYYSGAPEKLVEMGLPSWQWVDAVRLPAGPGARRPLTMEGKHDVYR